LHLPALMLTFSAVAHDQGLLNLSRTARFDACLCQPTSRSLPSSTSAAPKNRSFDPSFTSHLLVPFFGNGQIRNSDVDAIIPQLKAWQINLP